jgi:hypothetical protein
MYKKDKIGKVLFVVILVIIIFFNKDIHAQEKSNNNLFIKTGNLKLLLDKNSTAFSYNIHLYEDPGSRLLFIEQTYRGSIIIYDLKNRKLVKILRLPNKLLQDQPVGFFVNNPDSIYILLTKSSKLAIMNFQGELNDESITLSQENVIFPVVFTGRPVIKVGDELYISGVFNPDVENGYSVIVYNVKKNTRHYEIPISDEYKKGWWGNTIYISTISLSYNKEDHLLISSFPVDNYIYVYDSKGTVNKYYAGSKFIKQVSPYSKKKRNILEPSSIENHFAKTGYYSSIKYDEYRNVYYRYITKPVSGNEDFTSIRKHTIVILNDKFMKIGEWEVPESLDITKSFVDESGLNILNKEKYMQCQDTLYFDIYRLNKITMR